MSRKKRIFDIEMPEDPVVEKTNAPARRGPMASAIAENAEALTARHSAAQAIRDENDALAHEFVALRDAGQVVQNVPLEEVFTHLLVRDRFPGDDAELVDLMTSIREVGLSNPIRVEARADGTGFELIQGFRRLSAYRNLRAATGDDKWGRIPALVLPRGEDVAGLYRRMVDENIIRKDLSFAEMAAAANNFASDPATGVDDLKGAVKALFQSAPYSKRSYIRTFARLLELIGPSLYYPTELPRALGVAVAKQLEDNPSLTAHIIAELDAWENRSLQDEMEVLRRFAKADSFDQPAEAAKPAKRSGGAGADPAKTKTTFDLRSSRGRVKCTAAVGRLEIKFDRDFSTMDRARLERAIEALIDGLD
ncbi:ParB/RepB/Spo0J family partition protein [Yoonia sp. MH D7]